MSDRTCVRFRAAVVPGISGIADIADIDFGQGMQASDIALPVHFVEIVGCRCVDLLFRTYVYAFRLHPHQHSQTMN